MLVKRGKYIPGTRYLVGFCVYRMSYLLCNVWSPVILYLKSVGILNGESDRSTLAHRKQWSAVGFLYMYVPGIALVRTTVTK